MDTSVLGYEGSLHHWSCPSSDSEFYSVSSPETISPAATVSPAPSMDFVFSPQKRADAGVAGGNNNKFVAHLESTAAGDFYRRDSMMMGTAAVAAAGRPIRTRTRSRNPSKQRQSASEKEKLRMRDLTKALHHLRSYLPASVAPLGQTLTKIETLRLTIRYIDHLSAQLGTSQQDLEIHARRPSTNQTQGLHHQQQQQQAQNRSSSGGIHRVQEPSYGAQRKVEGGAMREESQQRAAPQQILGYFQCSSASVEGAWLSGQENRASVLTNQQQQRQGHGGSIAHGAQENTRMGRGLCQYGSSMQMPVQNETYSGGIGIDYLFQTAPTIQTTQSCQMYNREFGGYQLVPQEYWS